MEDKFSLLEVYCKRGLTVANQDDDTYKISFQHTSGSGRMDCYSIFDGILLCYNKFEVYDYYHADQKKIEGLIEINHCKRGRFECQFTNGKYCYISEGDLSVNSFGNTVKVSAFPLEYYEGLSVIIDIEKAQQSIEKAMPCVKINIPQVMQRLCQQNQCFIVRASDTIEHVLSELYHIPSKVQDAYMKIKIVELLVFLSVVDVSEKRSSNCYLPKNKVEKIKEIREKLINNLGERFTIEQLASEFNISPTALKNYFKGVFGCSVYSYVRNYRMKKAAYYLSKTNYTVTHIASLLGYTNSSKFSAAFKDVMYVTPSQYKKKVSK